MMPEQALGLLGLGRRAGALTLGTSMVRQALKRDQVRVVIVADDYSPRTRDKVVRLAEGRGVPLLVGPAAAELGRRLGERPVQVVGVRDAALARALYEKSEGERNVQEG